MRPRRCSRRNTACKASPVMVLTAWTWMCWAVNQFERCGGARRIGAVAASGAFYRAAAAACVPLFRLLRASGRRRGDKNRRRAAAARFRADELEYVPDYFAAAAAEDAPPSFYGQTACARNRQRRSFSAGASV